MIRSTIIFLITLNFMSCNIKKNTSNISHNYFNDYNNTSTSANYLTANYSIKKGDAYTASEILDKNVQHPKLLELKFFSNLLSGNFESADKVSKKLQINNKNNDLYKLPEYILKIKKNDFEGSLNVLKKENNFLNLDKLNDLIKFWIQENGNKNKFILKKYLKKTSIHELLILENFHNSKNLLKIADFVYKNSNLNSHDLFLLAGFYYRANNINKFEKIIHTKLSDQFDKHFIINNFSSYGNIFNKTPELQVILASKIFNIINDVNLEIYNSYTYKKILLEFSIFLNPKMDISKYSLAEIYNLEKTNELSFKNLDSISKDSFYFLAANLKKLTILNSFEIKKKYEILLFKIVKLWPKNKFVLYRLASYYKSKQEYNKSIKIYKKILDHYDSNERDLFLYASNLDKVGKWEEAKTLFLDILKKNPKDTYTLNYVSYKLALKEEDLELALNLIKKALILDPDNGYFLDTLGWVEYKRQNYNSAVYFLEKSVSILPRSSEVIDHLGDCYLMLNRKKEAVFEWKKALKYETDKLMISKIKEKLNKYEHVL